MGILHVPLGLLYPFNTASLFKNFSKVFQDEYIGLFDEVLLYNTDNNPSELITHKASADQELEILNSEIYTRFIAKRHFNPKALRALTLEDNVIATEHIQRGHGKGPAK
jgi:hypothetical protein